MPPWPLLLLAPLIEVEWDVPADCPSEAAFVEMVEAEARVEAEADDPPVLAASVIVRQRSAESWSLRLQLRRGEELDTRSFDGETCTAVVEAAALVVSLRIVEWVKLDPPDTLPEPAPDPQPPAPLPMAIQPEPAPEALVPLPEPPPQPAVRPLELGGWIGLRGGIAFGVAPSVSGAVSLDGGLTGRWWRVGVGMHSVPRRTSAHPNDPSVEGRFSLVAGDAFGCGSPEAGPVEFPVCGRVSVGGLRGTGEGNVGQSEPAWGLWSGLGGSAGVVWHLTERIAPALSIIALAPLRDYRFAVGSVPGSLHETGPVAIRAALGLEIHL